MSRFDLLNQVKLRPTYKPNAWSSFVFTITFVMRVKATSHQLNNLIRRQPEVLAVIYLKSP